jgi:hypothetical protein
MTRVAPIPPAETDLLCEFCGYTLNGLDHGGKCPECGMAIAASVASRREPPLWERRPKTFWATTFQIIFHPTAFFSGVTARGNIQRAARFGHAHWLIASLLFGLAAATHASVVFPMGSTAWQLGRGSAVPFAAVSYLSLWLTTRLAIRLTAFEASYRGIRLPLQVVSRSMYYHAAHYLPVGVFAAATVMTYAALLENRILDWQTLTIYLYVICAEIIMAAAYLFKTYWIGMRNLMYANR